MKTNSFNFISAIIFVAFFFSCNQPQKQVQVFQKSTKAVALNNKLARGWNTWNTRSVLSHVILPEKFAINLQLQDLESNTILEEALIGRRGLDAEKVYPGPHAYDGSYTELTIEWKSIGLNVKTAASGKDIAIVITPEKSKNPGNLLINPKKIWGGSGKVELMENGFSFYSDSASFPFYLIANEKTKFNDSTLIFSLKDKIFLSTYMNKSTSELESIISSAGRKHSEMKKKYGADSILYDAMQSVLAWDIIFDPISHNVVSPVSRIWNVSWEGWILFCWDTYFASLMYSLDSKELAYANAIAITKEISKNGFIPNFASSLGKSEDRSQPTVGSFTIWKIYERYKERWFLEEVFEELLSWNRWWEHNRDIDGYLVWGSDPYESELPDWLTKDIGKKQAAMWESGLDNSPMFDSAVYDTTTNKLMLADVGLISLYIWDCQYLSKIAQELGKNDICIELENRAEKYSVKLESLYDESSGIYLNKDLVTGQFSNRLSPTLFYPLLTGIPSLEKAERMINDHFYNPDEFWGDWIMPSISRNDSAFKDNSYWRGRIWAPMNFLVYCGIMNYNLPDAQRSIIEKSKELILKSWLKEHHIYENYNSVSGFGDDVSNSDKFYHWGALLAFMALLEN